MCLTFSIDLSTFLLSVHLPRITVAFSSRKSLQKMYAFSINMWPYDHYIIKKLMKSQRRYIYYKLDNKKYLCSNTSSIGGENEYNVIMEDEVTAGKTLYTVREEPEHSSGRNLFIIGNGFDLAHNLPTQYSCFRNYLLSLSIQRKEERDNMIIPKQMGPQIWHETDNKNIPYPPTEFYADIIRYLVDDAAGKRHRMDWCDFENYLGKLRFEKVVNKWEIDGDEEFAFNALREAVCSIGGLLFDWINTIELSMASPKMIYKDIIDIGRDYVITFNYTEALEALYGMNQERICHIHGKRETDPILIEKKKNLPIGERGCDLIVGTKDIKEREKKKRYTAIKGSLVKDTEYIISTHEAFFRKIQNWQINDIYSIGFSFSEADEAYIQKIISLYDDLKGTEGMTWHLSAYEKPLKRAKYKMKIRKAGFKGRVAVG